MKPAVYFLQQQLSELLNYTSFSRKGIGFYWEKEHIIHAHTSFPELPPTGKPMLVFFKTLDSFDGHYEQLKIIEQELNAKESVTILRLLCVFFVGMDVKALLLSEGKVSEFEVKIIPSTSQSPNIQAVEHLYDKKVAVVGLSHIGEQTCLNLAHAGLKRFFLFDSERVNDSNAFLHSGGWFNYGRHKTQSIKEGILRINAFTEVNTCDLGMSPEGFDILQREIQNSDLVICTTPLHADRLQVNQIGKELRKTVLFAKALRYGGGGEIFRLQAGIPHAPCLSCLAETNFFDASNEEAFNLIVGNSTGIGLAPHHFAPISSFLTHLVMTNLLSKSGIGEHEPAPDFFYWANIRGAFYGQDIISYGFDSQYKSTFRWYSHSVLQSRSCPICNA